MDGEEYFHSRESVQPVARYDRDRGQGRAFKARYGPRHSLESRSHNRDDGDNLRVAHRGEIRLHHHPRKMLLQPALSHLYDVLSSTHEFYEGFSRGYDKEVRGIRPYAGPEILERLWAIRAKMGDRSMGQGHHNALDEDGSNARHRDNVTNPEMNFRNCGENIQTAFETMIDAESPFKHSSVPKGSPTDAESLSRIVKKINIAYRGTSQLMRTAHKRQAHLTELLTELELVLVYLDKIKDIWEYHATKTSHGDLEESDYSPARKPHDTEQAWNDD